MRTTSPILSQLVRSIPNTVGDPADSVITVPSVLLNTVQIPMTATVAGSTSFPETLTNSGYGVDRRDFTVNGSFIALTLTAGLWRVRIRHSLIPIGANFSTALSRLLVRYLGTPVLIAEINTMCCHNLQQAYQDNFELQIPNQNTVEILQQIEGANPIASHGSGLWVSASRLL